MVPTLVAPSPEAVARHVEEIRARIRAACARAGRPPGDVTLVGVTKRVAASSVRAALDAGLSHLGESYVQEAVPKMKELSDRAPTWHLVGHLQRNKARKAVDLFDVIECVDSVELAETLSLEAQEIGRELRVYVQVNVGDEAGKHGVALSALPAFVEDVDTLPSLAVVGLMSIPPPADTAEGSRPRFRELREAFEALRRRQPELQHLSMGMSADFEVAIEEGATEVRVGTALFGAR
jgi:hypothetical protein